MENVSDGSGDGAKKATKPISESKIEQKGPGLREVSERDCSRLIRPQETGIKKKNNGPGLGIFDSFFRFRLSELPFRLLCLLHLLLFLLLQLLRFL